MKPGTSAFGRGRIVAAIASATGLAFGFGMPYPPQQKPARAAAKVDFVHDVQPIISAHCLPCHSAAQKAGGLSLASSQEILQGGVSGNAVAPTAPDKSLIVQRIEGKMGKPRMPMGFGPLSKADIATIRAWIDQGCKDSSGGKRALHWAYVGPVSPPVPKIKNKAWVRNPIDAFVMARLEKEGLRPSPEADKTTLIRRVTLDLTGLPPTPAEVDAFLADRSPNAYEKVVDRLFANPHYGERMALPWLDAARYADSNGFQTDGDNYQYVWRDWVVRAMNADMPFDKFTIEQLAGDLLPNPAQDDLVATAFNRNQMLNGEGGAIPEEQRFVAMFDRVDATATTWLGITMACARCHDHKYDPFTQRDYYSLLAFFNNVPETGIVETGGQYNVAKPWIYAGPPDQMAALADLPKLIQAALAKEEPYVAAAETAKAQTDWESRALSGGEKLPDDVAAALKTPADKRGKPQSERLRAYFLDNHLEEPGRSLRKARQDLDKRLETIQEGLPKVMVMSDAQPRKTFVLSRGNYTVSLDEVGPRSPACLPSMSSGSPTNRLGLARWIVASNNPLTARVQVDRYWQTFFGRGLVKTPENFGVQCEVPEYAQLLDWLAVQFRSHGWDVKRLQRLILTSATYRQSSRVSPAMARRDPENRLLARGARFRLPSMLIRDCALAASGLLNPAVGGKPVYPYQPKGIWDSLNITDERNFDYPQSHGADLYRRSLYTFWRRTVGPGDIFDAATRQVCTVRLSHTSSPLHALTTLNDVAWVEAGRALAQRVMGVPGSTPKSRLADAFRRVCARRPGAAEVVILRRILDHALAAFKADPNAAATYLSQGESPRDPKLDTIEHAAYATVCLAILNLDEALSRE